MKKLFLDDCRNPPDSSWDVVRSYAAFVEYVEKNGVPDVISFDHDLGAEHYKEYSRIENARLEGRIESIQYHSFEEKTGYDCAKWLVERGTLPQTVYVHSLNPVGRKNILFIMEEGYRLEKERGM